MTELLRRGWNLLRRVSGDDAYDRYLAHCRQVHGAESARMSRKAFFRAQERRKWERVNRCC